MTANRPAVPQPVIQSRSEESPNHGHHEASKTAPATVMLAPRRALGSYSQCVVE
jgi:hypothetical protein